VRNLNLRALVDLVHVSETILTKSVNFDGQFLCTILRVIIKISKSYLSRPLRISAFAYGVSLDAKGTLYFLGDRCGVDTYSILKFQSGKLVQNQF
jgi:hypothetical protein